MHLDKANFYRIPCRWYLAPAGMQHMFHNVDAPCWRWCGQKVMFVFAVPKILASSDLNNRCHGGQRPLLSGGLSA